MSIRQYKHGTSRAKARSIPCYNFAPSLRDSVRMVSALVLLVQRERAGGEAESSCVLLFPIVQSMRNKGRSYAPRYNKIVSWVMKREGWGWR